MSDTSKFSFGVPSTFHLASDSQKQILLKIAEKEFTLSHLSAEDQELVGTALRYSGIEVSSFCQVEKKADYSFKGFFRSMQEPEHKQFDPDRGMLDHLPQPDKNGVTPTPSWTPPLGDTEEYPYPFSEEQVIAKVVPINLSSIQPTSRTDSIASFTAQPSKLMTARLEPKDILWEVEDMSVHFDIDLTTQRLTQQTVELKKSKRVFFGIRVSRFNLHYKFDNDSATSRNVLTRTSQTMSGRLYLLFNPRFTISGEYAYSNCKDDPTNESYIYQSITALSKAT